MYWTFMSVWKIDQWQKVPRILQAYKLTRQCNPTLIPFAPLPPYPPSRTRLPRTTLIATTTIRNRGINQTRKLSRPSTSIHAASTCPCLLRTPPTPFRNEIRIHIGVTSTKQIKRSRCSRYSALGGRGRWYSCTHGLMDWLRLEQWLNWMEEIVCHFLLLPPSPPPALVVVLSWCGVPFVPWNTTQSAVLVRAVE